MLTKEQEIIENYDLVFEKMSTANFALSVVFMCFAEFALIHGLWFSRNHMGDDLDRFLVPFMVFVPAFLSFAFRFSIGNMLKAGQIGAKTATMLKFNLGIITMVTYIAIWFLAKLGHH